MPDKILPLLRCPLCTPPRLLTAPLTLHCGHTVCAEHLASPSSSVLASIVPSATPATVPKCPLPTCRPSSPSPASPRAASGVAVSPATTAAPPSAYLRAARVDVTANKIISLVLRARTWSAADRTRVSAYAVDPDEHTDSEGDADSGPPGLDEDDRDRDRSAAGPDRNHDRRGLPIAARSAADRPDPGPSTPPEPDARPARRSPSPSPSPSPPLPERAPSPQSRPRKRRRRLTRPSANTRPDSDLDTHINPAARFEKELQAELTCEICFGLLWQPVTTPCQHTFCATCLHRALDHSTACPLCRQTLPGYAYFQEHPCNKVVLAIILKAFPDAYSERAAALEEEARDARLDTPLFVCQLSFPGMPTMLHFFEPRYRLMLRRCLATPRPCFGMIPPPRTSQSSAVSGSNEYGTMLEIRNVQMLPDGRSVVETWGTWRFRVMERGTLDGYVVARVERIDDIEDEDGAGPASASDRALDPLPLPGLAAAPTNAELLATCHAFLDQLREGTPWVVQHLNNAYVPMPEDPAAFSFWMGMLLPIDDHEKAKMLPIRSPRLRLRLVVHWIEQLNNNWTLSYASASRVQVVLWGLRRLLMRLFFSRGWPYAFTIGLIAVYAAQVLLNHVTALCRGRPGVWDGATFG